MLRNLLEERFRLVARREVKSVPVSALDPTSLKGTYDIDLRFTPEPGG